MFVTNRGATLGLVGAAVAATIRYLPNNPCSIGHISVAAAVVVVVVAKERAFPTSAKPVVAPEF
jgi:SSS family solute:Na+ symporter